MKLKDLREVLATAGLSLLATPEHEHENENIGDEVEPKPVAASNGSRHRPASTS